MRMRLQWFGTCKLKLTILKIHESSQKVYCCCMEKVVHSLSEESIELFPDVTWQNRCETNAYCDALLRTDDGVSFVVHRSILSLCSPYFKVLFAIDISTDECRWFSVPGITSNVLKDLIEYAYSNKITLNEENIQDLLIGADQFLMLDLLKECCDFLLFNLTFQNCISVRQFARSYFCFELEERANRFLMKHFIEILEQSEEFLELSIEEVTEILNSDHLNVKGEEQVWEAVVRWIDCRPDERSQHINNIMRCVRLGLLETQYFINNVILHNYVENNELCQPIIIETMNFLRDLEMIGQQTEEIETPFLATPRIPNSILFAIGGWSAGSPTDFIEAYDSKADRWVEVNATDPRGGRAYHKLAVIEHTIYVIGGLGENNSWFRSCRCFNVVTKEWKEIASMHSKRCCVSVATLDNLIYAMGGYNGRQRQNTTERYDYHTNQWTIVAPMNVQRSDACAASLNGFIYIVGGYNGNECLASCEYYDPAMNQWTYITSLYYRRSGVSVINHHGKVYAIGGFNGISRLNDGEMYDPSTEEWTEVPDMHISRSNFAIEVTDDMIFAIGGCNGVGAILHVESFNDYRNEWLNMSDMNCSRTGLAACVVHDLPNIEDYIHQNRRGLLEEQRQRLIQQRDSEISRHSVAPRPLFQPQIADGINQEE